MQLTKEIDVVCCTRLFFRPVAQYLGLKQQEPR